MTPPLECRHCDHPIRRNPSSSTGWEHWPGDPAKGWQGIRCPGRICGAEPPALAFLRLIGAGDQE